MGRSLRILVNFQLAYQVWVISQYLGTQDNVVADQLRGEFIIHIMYRQRITIPKTFSWDERSRKGSRTTGKSRKCRMGTRRTGLKKQKTYSCKDENVPWDLALFVMGSRLRKP